MIQTFTRTFHIKDSTFGRFYLQLFESLNTFNAKRMGSNPRKTVLMKNIELTMKPDATWLVTITFARGTRGWISAGYGFFWQTHRIVDWSNVLRKLALADKELKRGGTK